MATMRLVPVVVIAIFVVNLVSSEALQSSLLSSLAGQDKSPVLLFLDNSALSKAQSSNRYERDQTEDSNNPLLTLLSQLTQPKTSAVNHRHSQSHLNRIHNRRPRDRRDHVHRHRDDDDRSDERDRRDSYYSRQQERSDRGRYRTYRQREDRYRRPLRTDDKREPQEEKGEQPQREVRAEQPKYRAGSAQAQIPVIKSILRSLNCNAKYECQDECQEAPKRNQCENECEVKYDCQEEEEENDSCDEGCATTKSCTIGGSTKGVTLETEKPYCSRC